ncbi:MULTISPECIES: glycoside hydrolase family 3 protein [unclassified Sphingomonas]|uniref:glycoside hydrolase family 3 protein n=1 Tax=unclassified Sphingomonas TaxID=196159 RepID=UPI000A5CAE59|nr:MULTISPECIES: glycoside hydrolase family 3 protein [unclassified Sphingomonas]
MRRTVGAAWIMLGSMVAAAGASVGLAHQGRAQPAPAETGVADPGKWPRAASPATITTPATEAEIDRLIARMTLRQKVGQLIQADIASITPADLAEYPLGSILAGGNSGPFGDERASPAKWAELVAAFRDASRKAGAGVPILFGVDAVHGHSNLPGATIFPHNIGLGAARDPELIQRIGAATAAEIAGSGIEWTFAPTLAVPQDPRWGRTYEGYSSDPALVADYARAMTLGLQGTLVAGRPLDAHRVAATAKHFLADGGTQDGRDQGDAVIGEAELIDVHARGYPPAIDAGALTVMASFSSWNGVKHHGNKSLLTDVLKQRMGFAGLVVGDWNGHGQIPGCRPTDCPAAVNAGLDLYMAPDSWKGLFASTLAAAQSGRIPAARIDDAVRRILRVKFKLGLMGTTPVARGDVASIGAPDHLALAREAVAKSLVLLKNQGNVLPVRPGSRVLIAGSGADDMAMQAGGWTISWQGTDTRAQDFPRGRTIGRAIVDGVAAGGGTATLAPMPSDAEVAGADTAIVVLGEKPYAEFEGDVPSLAFRPAATDAALVARLKAAGKRVVILFLSGRPMFVGGLLNQADAFVAGWLPGTQGEGVADVLIAGANGRPARDFTGRLPFAWPDDARAPVKQPLFPVGYGLDYTRGGSLARVNEDPRVDLAAEEVATNFVVRGKVPAPWRLADDGAIATRAIDLKAQEDARQLTWLADAVLTINGPAIDLTRQSNGGLALFIEWRIDRRAAGPVRVAIGEGAIDLTAALAASTPGTVVETRVPLHCFEKAGTKIASVGSPFRVQAPKGFVATLRSVRIEAGSGVAACPGTSNQPSHRE